MYRARCARRFDLLGKRMASHRLLLDVLLTHGTEHAQGKFGTFPKKIDKISFRNEQNGCRHLRVIVGLLDDLTLKDMETRVANWLLKRCPRPVGDREVEIKLDRTKRVLAAELGATSDTLSRTLAKFRDRKLLRVKGNTITVTRPGELQKLLRKHLGEI